MMIRPAKKFCKLKKAKYPNLSSILNLYKILKPCTRRKNNLYSSWSLRNQILYLR